MRTLLVPFLAAGISFAAAPVSLNAASEAPFVAFSSPRSVADAVALRAKLAEAIVAKEASASPDELLKNEGYLRALYAHEVLRVTGDDALKAFYASRPDAGDFLANFLNDSAWMEAYLTAGKIPEKTPVGLTVLADIWKKERLSPSWSKWHALSCAIASSWAMGAWKDTYIPGKGGEIGTMNPTWRYGFFRDRAEAGKMHAMFSKLKSWEMHPVVGFCTDDASLVWCNDRIRLPLQRYVDACWLASYRMYADFGDFIQGPHFYTPWRGTMCNAENTLTHGGVCGSLSTFGVIASVSRGIPAFTAGQPGHCAYGVRFARGDWRGGFGGPDGGIGSLIWAGNIHSVMLVEKVFGDDAGLARAIGHAARARLYASRGDDAKAESAYDLALAASPCHRDIHFEKMDLLKSRADAGFWRKYAESLLSPLGEHGAGGQPIIAKAASHFLSANDKAGAFAWFAKEHAAYVHATETWTWDFNGSVLDQQAKLVGFDVNGKHADTREYEDGAEVFRIALTAQLASEKRPQIGKVMEWATRNLLTQGGADFFRKAFESAVASAAGKTDDKTLAGMYGNAILGIENARSLPAFQALGKQAAPYAKKLPPITLNKPEGRLVSDKAMMRLSSSAWDDPVSHLNVLNETGGFFHTNAEIAPEIIVTLSENIELSGLLVVKTAENPWRLKRMQAFRSTDGETWHPITEIAEMPDQWRIDCPPGTRASWIKIKSLPEKADYMHLRNVLVYAK